MITAGMCWKGSSVKSLKSCNSNLKSVFVTGTDTEVGKTIITGLLARYIAENGFKVITQKWIQTGSSGFADDIDTHLKLMKLARADIKDCLPLVCPYVFKYPSSPHLAAKLEKRKISQTKIKKSFLALSKRFDCVIVEGIGGALVPFNEKNLVIDIAAELKLPALIVTDNKLGAVNHTLLTIEAIKKRKMNISPIVFNNTKPVADNIITEDNPRIIARQSGEKISGCLPFVTDTGLLYEEFADIGKKILTFLKKKE